MGIDTSPAINLARRIVEKCDLEPPIPIDKLIKRFAELRYAKIPFTDIDGISLHLKVRGKKPRVVCNASHHVLRQRFTLAHELGHIIIPWHVGTIVDRADPCTPDTPGSYWEIEREANSFAAELLMPQKWIEPKMMQEENIAKLHRITFHECRTSALAAAIRIAGVLPTNYVYASVKEGTVEFSGRTPGSLAPLLDWGSRFTKDAYHYCKSLFVEQTSSRTLYWWLLSDTVKVPEKDRREWKQILDDIFRDLRLPQSKIRVMKSSINGIVASANGRLKGNTNYGVDLVATTCMQRLNGNATLKAFVKHKDFDLYVFKKALDMVRKT